MAIETGKLGYTRMFVPAENAYEAAVVTGLSVYPVPDVFTLIDHLRGTKPLYYSGCFIILFRNYLFQSLCKFSL